MFDKLLNKKSKPLDYFQIPQKPSSLQNVNHHTIQKILSKMSQKDIRQLCQDQQKYIATLIKRFQQAKGEYSKISQKCDEMTQKNQIINQQIKRMTNQHQQLAIKFNNLSQVLEMCTSQKQQMVKSQCKFLQENGLILERNQKNLQNILKIYQTSYHLCKKIQVQNKTLKTKLADLEQQAQQLQNNLKNSKNHLGSSLGIPIHDKKVSMKNVFEEYGTMETEQSNKSTRRARTQDIGIQTEKQNIKQINFFQEKNQVQKNIQKLFEQREIQTDNQKIDQNQLKYFKKDKSFISNEEHQKLIKSLRQQIILNKNQIQKFENQTKSLKEKINTLNQNLSQKDKKCLQMHTQKQNLIQKYHQKIKNLSQEITQLEKTNKKYQQELSQFKIKMLEVQQKTQNNISSISINQINQVNYQQQNKQNEKEREFQELSLKLQKYQKLIQVEKFSKTQTQKKAKNFQDQIKSLKNINKRINQEKQILLMSNKQHLQTLNQNLIKKTQECQDIKTQIKKLNQQISKLKLQKQNLVLKSKNIQDTLNGYHLEFQNNQNQKASLIEKNKKLEDQIGLLKRQIQRYNKRIDQITQESQCKQRKHQSEFNQERIKIDSLKRSLHNMQNKYEQTKLSLEKTYQENMFKGTKIVTLQTKLKQYKRLIQVLKKQKVEMQQTFEEKLKSHNNTVSMGQQMTLQDNSYEEGAESPKQHHNYHIQGSDDVKYNQDLAMRQKMIDLEDKNLNLQAQLQILEEKLRIIQEQNDSHETTIRNLNQKRDLMVKQLQKFAKRNSVPINFSQTSTTIIKNQQNKSQQLQKKQQKSRQRRIAQKAIKGFQIQRRLLNQLYKDFIKHFADQIATNDNVKQIQKNMNILINKTIDMKDIFQDYIV